MMFRYLKSLLKNLYFEKKIIEKFEKKFLGSEKNSKSRKINFKTAVTRKLWVVDP